MAKNKGYIFINFNQFFSNGKGKHDKPNEEGVDTVSSFLGCVLWTWWGML